MPPPPIPPAGKPSTMPSVGKGILQFVIGAIITLAFNGMVLLGIIASMTAFSLGFPGVFLLVIAMLGVNAAAIAMARVKGLPFVSTGIFTVTVITALLLALPLYVLWSCQSSGF